MGCDLPVITLGSRSAELTIIKIASRSVGPRSGMLFLEISLEKFKGKLKKVHYRHQFDK